jgi:60kDa lysophospholipase
MTQIIQFVSHKQAYSLHVVQAIRVKDLDAMQSLLRQEVPLHGCNSHGESTIHLACRLGNVEIVKFLVREAGVSVRVQDDSGRKPLA